MCEPEADRLTVRSGATPVPAEGTKLVSMATIPTPHSSRVSHPITYRRLSVQRVTTLTPGMRRIVLGGADLEGFTTQGFDDHVKLFFPDANGHLPTMIVAGTGVRPAEGEPRPEGRDFTPRRYDAAARELTIDFGLHGSGPATVWAKEAVAGSVLGVAGPRGSEVLTDAFAWHLLIGDDTALPAIARRFEECPPHVRLFAVIEVDDESERQPLAQRADGSAQVTWVHRKRGVDGVATTLEEAVAALTLPEGPGIAWAAGEAAVMRRIRQHLLQDRGLPAQTLKVAAYWRDGATGKHEILGD